LIADQVVSRHAFRDVVTTESELSRIVGRPSFWFQGKMLKKLDGRCRRFIAMSPFVMIASTSASGQIDVSPKGDPAGFVQVLDEVTLAVPDRAGNRRVDTFHNILQNPDVGLIFLVPGKGETLRVCGKAMIVRDLAIRESMSINGRVPELATIVSVERAYFHCAKCIARSKLWENGQTQRFIAPATSPVSEREPVDALS
jgi:PPOX class probable FMN-dependent enzyme